MALNPKDWPERQAAFTKAYLADPQSFPKVRVHARWTKPWPEKSVQPYQPGFMGRRSSVPVLIWPFAATHGAPASLLIEITAGLFEQGDNEVDAFGVGELEMNGAMALLLEDGPHFPLYNPIPPLLHKRL